MMQKNIFLSAIENINQYDIHKCPLGENIYSLFQYCSTEAEVDKLLAVNYLQFWSAPIVFTHLCKIMSKPTDEILMKIVPKLNDCSLAYFFNLCDLGEMPLFRTAILLDSIKLLQLLVEMSKKDVIERLLNSHINIKLACSRGNKEIILFLSKYCTQRSFEIDDDCTLLCNYLDLSAHIDKEIVELLVTGANIAMNGNMDKIRRKLGGEYLYKLQEKVFPLQKPELQKLELQSRDLGNMVDVHGNVICKNPAELAIAVFDVNDKLQPDRMERIFIKSSEIVLRDIEGKQHLKKFINGIYVDIPTSVENDKKVRFHMLTIHDKNMLVRFDKIYYEGVRREFN